ncbi:hypothetical protein MKX01_009858 [Papaver californicum]|nr:hypothetical protein MKX01_009858 [Papaver californicum]
MYFMCGTQGHCSSGLKVKIVVNSTDLSGSGDSSNTDDHPPPRRNPPSVRSPYGPRQSAPPPSKTHGTLAGSLDVPPDPHVPGSNSCPYAATKITHHFIITFVISLILLKLMIIHQ